MIYLDCWAILHSLSLVADECLTYLTPVSSLVSGLVHTSDRKVTSHYVLSCVPLKDIELWCWRRLLRVAWAARRSKQSILNEVNPECSLEGLMLIHGVAKSQTQLSSWTKRCSSPSLWDLRMWPYLEIGSLEMLLVRMWSLWGRLEPWSAVTDVLIKMGNSDRDTCEGQNMKAEVRVGHAHVQRLLAKRQKLREREGADSPCDPKKEMALWTQWSWTSGLRTVRC